MLLIDQKTVPFQSLNWIFFLIHRNSDKQIQTMKQILCKLQVPSKQTDNQSDFTYKMMKPELKAAPR